MDGGQVPAAVYALAGTLIGVLGTVLADAVRGKRDKRRQNQEQLRNVCSEFMAYISRLRRYSIALVGGPPDQEAWRLIETTFTEARVCYEQLLITTESIATQEAARHLLHFAYWLTRAAHMERTGFDEIEAELRGWCTKLYSEVRLELGLKNPNHVYEDPIGGLRVPGQKIERPYEPPSSGTVDSGLTRQRQLPTP
jgi:hypothetical protein